MFGMFGHESSVAEAARAAPAPPSTDFTRLEIIMSSQRIFGIVLFILGIVFLWMGMHSSHSVADQVSNTFTGRFTERTTWYIIGGIALGLLGLAMVLFGGGAKPLLARRGS